MDFIGYPFSAFMMQQQSKELLKKAKDIIIELNSNQCAKIVNPPINDKTNKTIKTKNNIFAMPAVAADIPVKPKIAAIIEIIKKANAQYNIFAPF